MFQDEFLLIASEWSVEQLTNYIGKLEARIAVTRALVTELKVLRKQKTRKKPVDTGARDGR